MSMCACAYICMGVCVCWFKWMITKELTQIDAEVKDQTDFKTHIYKRRRINILYYKL